MSRAALPLALLLSAGAVAAPIPKERDDARLKRVFGTVVAPDKECEFELLPGDRLRLHLPAKAYTIHPSGPAAAAPRVTREIEGDFALTVRVATAFDKAAGPAIRGSTPQTSAGLFLKCGDDVTAELERTYQSNRNGWQSIVQFHARQPGRGMGSSSGFQFDTKPVHLRLTRTGAKVVGESSPDGKTWRRASETELPLGGPLTVGLFAAGTLDTSAETVFDEFSLTPPKPGK